MSYAVNPVVTIADVDYSGKALNGVNCTAGRTDINQQPRAGFCSINIVNFDDEQNTIEVDQKIEIKVDNSLGTPVVLWTGWVADVTKTIRQYGGVGYVIETRVSGIGSLAKLNRRRVGVSGYPKEFDGDRIYDILFETAGITWADVAPTLQWEDVSPLQNWATYDILIGTIERPGDFELAAVPSNANGVNGLSLMQEAANSGLGILYECTCGSINYDTYTSRADEVSANGFTYIDLDAIIANGLTATSRLSDIANNVEVVYKNNQREKDTDQNSIFTFGEYDVSITTTLENEVDAEQRVEHYLTTRAYPRTTLSQLGLVLHVDDVDDTLRDELIGLKMSKPIAVTNLPANLYDQPFTGFVEGYTWTISRNELFLTLNVSDYALTQLQTNWLQVPAAEQWQTVSPTLEWAQARSVS